MMKMFTSYEHKSSTTMLVGASILILNCLVAGAQDPCVGIDVGSTNSFVAVSKEGSIVVAKPKKPGQKEALSASSIPSVVAYVEKEGIADALSYEVVFGEEAKKQQLQNVLNTVSGFKRLMGRSYGNKAVKDNSHPVLVEDNEHHHFAVATDASGAPRIVLTGGSKSDHEHPSTIGTTTVSSGVSDPTTSLSIPHIYAELLKFLANVASATLSSNVMISKNKQIPIGSLVVAVPASFNDQQKQAVKDAGTISGLDIIKIVSEPVAACLAYGLNSASSGADRTILVVHAGGATVEASLVSLSAGFFELTKSRSNHSLVAGGPAGLAMDVALLDHILHQAERKADATTDVSEKWSEIRSNVRAVNRIRKMVEVVKKQLSSKTKAKLELKGLLQQGGTGGDLVVKISREEFESLLGSGSNESSLLGGMLKTIRSALDVVNKKPTSGTTFDELILIGGVMHVPAVQYHIQNDPTLMRLWSGNKKKGIGQPIVVNKGLKAEEVAAFGAAAQCKISLAKEE